MSQSACPFCNLNPSEIFYQGEEIVGIWALYPVTPGHALLIPRRHTVDWFAASPSEQTELSRSIVIARRFIEENHSPLGYNVGLNCGVAAGQTVFHLHLHVVPRYGEAPSGDPEVKMITPSADKQRRL